ncbi:hypothetical protein Tco_0990676 [Tanacetum coccineum]|uniref:Uncharacterized protein n=1 Tax=Tanacetum coccineum TaxID=301880 RepID=A0ABQ5EXJ0_9ASTR
MRSVEIGRKWWWLWLAKGGSGGGRQLENHVGEEGNLIVTWSKKQNVVPSEEPPDQNTEQLSADVDNIVLNSTFSYLHGYGGRQRGYVVLGIGQTRFLVKSWCGYAISLLLDTAY